MLKDITFGQYYEGFSQLHKLDPRTKILLLVLVMVFLFVANNFFGIALFALLFVVAAVISRVPVKMFLKNIKAIWILIVFTALINIFYNNSGTLLFKVWVIEVTTGGLYRASFMAIRIVLLIMISSLLTYTTTPNELTDAIESLLSPLKYIGLKNAVHTLAMMMSIALRFIPTLVEETEKIMNAQKARGADLENGKFFERIKALIPILIPLLISSIRRAYELAEAMECRCYNGAEGRVRMKQLKFAPRDLFAAVICIILCAGVILFNLI